VQISIPISNTTRKRALIVNCYVDETRRPVARRHKVPNTLGPVFLAGGLNAKMWDILLYNEVFDGPLEDESTLGWPDLVVLTGLITSVDRMRQIAAAARTKNPRVVIAGGGHVARAIPSYCATFLDYVCLGDVEEIQDVVREAFGAQYAAEEFFPRFDLAYYFGRVGHVESSRYCNFGCSFCTLTGEGRPYKPVPADHLRRQLEAMGRKSYIGLNDNNFYGNNRASFRERVAVMGEGVASGLCDGWTALVTNDFFLKRENLELVRDAGCTGLFSGVESFDDEWNRRHNKHHNTVRSQVEIIRECLQTGVTFLYGMMVDPTTRSIAEIRRELDFIVGCPEIPMPSYVSIPIPIPGTPFFYDCLDEGLILPGTKFRDLDATTVSLRPRGSLDEAAGFARDLQSMRGYRRRILRHSLRFAANYRKYLSPVKLGLALYNAPLLCEPLLTTLPKRIGKAGGPRTHISTTEPLDTFYRPKFRIDSRYESAFRPTMLTDIDGRLNGEIADDVAAGRTAARPLKRAVAGA
jgi:hypothetical protein